MTLSIEATTDLTELAREINRDREAVMSGATPPAGLAGEVVESWTRVQAAGNPSTIDEHHRGRIDRAELEARRAAHPLRHSVHSLKRVFAQSADDPMMALGIFDADGVML